MILTFEIGTEELPPGEIAPALDALRRHIEAGTQAARLSTGDVRTYASPRRLAVQVSEVASQAETVEETLTGPAAKIAFDADGNPTRAAIGFAKGKGLDPSELIRVETERGAYVAAVVRREGEHATDIFARVLSSAFGAVTWKRSMRWGWSEESFARPVHWIVAMLDSRVLDVEFAGVAAGDVTYGHRFMSPDAIRLATASQYASALREAYVEVDVCARIDAITGGVAALAAESGLVAIPDRMLAEEVAQLVEWPVPLQGTFRDDLLEVPREVLITSMRSHQKYFAFESEDGTLANRFGFISNMVVPNPSVVVRGNERVLLARLEDAKFFFREDRRCTLDERVEPLAAVRYIEGLGSILDRTERITSLAEKLSATLYPNDAAIAASATRAARLCKADLVTGMVGEFASLQGVMGSYYATLSGEPDAVATAIREHYAPKGASDAPPKSPAGVVVALADKLESIVGCFALGLVPSGSADPYALRRSALGILRTCLEREHALPIRDLVAAAYDGLPDPASLGAKKVLGERSEVVRDVCEFIYGRLRSMLASEFPTDIADAVVAVIGDDLPSAKARAATLDRMRVGADFDALAAAFKRTVNILRKVEDGLELDALPNAMLFQHEAELGLAQAVSTAEAAVFEAEASRDFEAVGAALSGLKPAIDAFFDGPMVNVEDQAVRLNRLLLLDSVRRLFQRFADISRIQVDGN